MITPRQISADSELFALKFLKILNKEKQLVPLRWNKAQRNFHANRTSHDLVLKARQLGFTTQIQGELFHQSITRTTNTLTLTNLGDATTKIRMMADRFYDNCSFGNIKPARTIGNATMSKFADYDSVAAIATAGSIETGRGDTYSHFHGSEVAFWPDAERIVAGAMQGGNPQVVLESTPNGSQGYFYERCMEALHGGGVWKLHFFPWWWDKEYRIPLLPDELILPDEEEAALMVAQQVMLSPEQLKWRRRKKMELKAFFIQEYPEDPVSCFITSGFGYFGDLTGVFTADPNPEYNPTHHYSAGLDFAQTNDFTCLTVLDFTTKQMVDFLHVNKLPWAEMRRRIKAMCKKWNIDILLAEKNSIGQPNIEALRAMSIHIIGFETNHESKSSIMSSLHEALHNGNWRLQDLPVLRNELSIFVADQLASGIWRLQADGDGHDDSVMSLALAYEAGRHTVSDEELKNYGSDQNENESLDDDMIAYRADTRGISFEAAKAMLQKEKA